MPSFRRFPLDTGPRDSEPCRIPIRPSVAAGRYRPLGRRQDDFPHRARSASHAGRACRDIGRQKSIAVFRVHAEGRLVRGAIQPQPDDAVPRFAYEDHIVTLTGPGGDADKRAWPESTRRTSELRLTLEFERDSGFGRRTSQLTIDLIDYPGEWLLDLPLLGKSYQRWSQDMLDASLTRRVRRWLRNGAPMSQASILRPRQTRASGRRLRRCSRPIFAPAARSRSPHRRCPPGRFPDAGRS